jgi:hypothetical protein
MKNFRIQRDRKLWGVLGKQKEYYHPNQFVGEQIPLNANPLDAWDTKKSKYKRVDLVPRNAASEENAEQGGVVPTGGVVTSPTPTPTITQTNTPSQTQTQTPSQTATQTNTPTPSFTPTPTSTPYPLPSTPDLWYDSTNVGSIDYITSGGTDYVSGWRSIGTYSKTLTGTTTDTMPVWSASTQFPGNPKIIRFNKSATAGLRDFLSQRYDSTVITGAGVTAFYVFAKPAELTYSASSGTLGFGNQFWLYSGNTTTGGYNSVTGSGIAPRLSNLNVGSANDATIWLLNSSASTTPNTFAYSATNLNNKFLWTTAAPFPTGNPYVEINQSATTFTTAITGTPITTFNSFIIGGIASSGGTITASNAGMELAEVMIYTKELTYQQRVAVQNYLRDKWRYDEWNSPNPVPTPTPSITPSQTTTPTNTPTPSATPPPASGTTEAQTYLRAVVDAGGTGITSTVSAATTTLFTSLVSNGLWDKLIAFYPMLGGNSSGCKFNGKNPVDTNAGYRLVFNGGWTYNASGATSNGTNAYADTFLSASTITPLNSQHLSIYMANANVSGATSRFYAGANGGGLLGVGFSSSLYWYYGVSDAGGSVFPFTTAQSQGNILITANATASSLLYRNGTQQQTTVNGNGASIPYSFYIGALNNAGTPQQYYGNQYRFSTIGYGLSAAQVSTLSTIINTFQTSLTRNVY